MNRADLDQTSLIDRLPLLFAPYYVAAERAATCRRYRAGSDAAEKLAGVFDYTAARQVVRSMSVNNWTMWTSVYDLTKREVRVLYKSRLDSEYRDEIPCLTGSEPLPASKPAAKPATDAKTAHSRAKPIRRRATSGRPTATTQQAA